jgi:A/G-specific adenine glycosylase
MQVTRTLLNWYKNHRRDLPWRHTTDPYHIWVSEIILQQTRIEQGLGYYMRFTERFPNVKKLAAASEEEVLKTWQGLGYYSRARNMHKAALTIVRTFNGQFPGTYDEIRKLTGIGDYTAAAIASLAFGLPCPVVDGNVLRFFSRYFGISDPIDSVKAKKDVHARAKNMMGDSDPGTFNQAIMEFGAMQCRPGIPDCGKCPLNDTCNAFLHHKVDKYPVKKKSPGQRKRYFHYLVMTGNDENGRYVYMKRRESEDIWRNLYDFPLVETLGPVTDDKLTALESWQKITGGFPLKIVHRSPVIKHILSHQVIHTRFYRIDIPDNCTMPFIKAGLSRIDLFPVPRLIEKFLEEEFL